MVLEQQHEHGSQWPAMESIAAKLGCTAETLRKWVRRAETIIGLFKTEVIHARGLSRTLDAVEYAKREWVDWFNHRASGLAGAVQRLKESCRDSRCTSCRARP
jgi:hypothetical protein